MNRSANLMIEGQALSGHGQGHGKYMVLGDFGIFDQNAASLRIKVCGGLTPCNHAAQELESFCGVSPKNV